MSLGLEKLIYQTDASMTHQGLPVVFAETGLIILLLLLIVSAIKKQKSSGKIFKLSLFTFIPKFLTKLFTQKLVLLTLKVLFAGIFLLIIIAGLFGTQIAERNIATTLTWTIWWSTVVLIGVFLGSFWCSICPWDTLANWISKQTIWLKSKRDYSLNMTVPRKFRNISIASFLFIILSWFELAWGITISPYATAILSLMIVFMASASILIFERKAFCQYFCPIGRTIGIYSKLSFTRIQPIDANICLNCTTLECFHGNTSIEPCPTNITLGLAKDHSYCISCGNCIYSCPSANVSWQTTSARNEIYNESKINSSESWFLIILYSLTLFHGITMLPFWEEMVSSTAVLFNDSGRLLTTFSFFMISTILLVAVLFKLTVRLSSFVLVSSSLGRDFRMLSIVLLPLALSYHIAHNFTHFFLESAGFTGVILNPLGINTLPLSPAEIHTRHISPLVTSSIVYYLQTGILICGSFISFKLAYNRLMRLLPNGTKLKAIQLLPLYFMIFMFSFLEFLLLMQAMIMRH